MPMFERRRIYGREAIDYARRFEVLSELDTYTAQEDGSRLVEPVGTFERAELLAAADPTLVWVEFPTDDRFQRLAFAFGSLKDAAGIHPWQPMALLRWLCSGRAQGRDAEHAARFLLGAWNTSTDWTEIAAEQEHPHPHAAKRFDVYDALLCWNRSQREAFLDWVHYPYFP